MREVERLHQGDGRVRVKGQSLTGTLEVQHICTVYYVRSMYSYVPVVQYGVVTIKYIPINIYI